MKASLDYFTEQFGPIPYRTMSIAEIPPYGSLGSAHPGLIAFSETFFNIRADESGVDEPFYGTAHEIAHHWWGGQVRIAAVPGASFLSESLANYSALILTEKTYGPEMARRVYDGHMDRYLRGRAEQSREVPVLDVGGQPYIAYRKGALAMYILRDHIGEERVNAALRRYMEKYRDAGPPFPTSRDLYAELRAVTPDSLHGLLERQYLKRHRIRSGTQTIRITLPREPARAGIDPWRKLFDRQRDDNVVEVKAAHRGDR